MASSLNIVIFGLTISSSWGNGHATLWRGLLRALSERGHTVTFYEKDVPYYAGTRDLHELPGRGRLKLYSNLKDIEQAARCDLDEADLAICTSYCPSGAAIAEMILNSRASMKAFYDLDTPVTMEALQSGKPLEYIPADGLAGFDLVLSYTGGKALEQLQSHLGAKRVVPLYGWVDPSAHYPVAAQEQFRADLSYLGTYAEDRQHGVQTLFIDPARQMPGNRFLLGGAQYPDSFPWTQNIYFQRHMPPAMHPAFFCSSRWTLNVTRRAMAENGYCPSGRLFEAAACGTPLISDVWDGLDELFTPGEQIVFARGTDDVIAALSMTEAERQRIATAARERTLAEHTAAARVLELEALYESVLGGAAFLPQAGSLAGGGLTMWGIIPAAGLGSRIQPLAFSKELLPVGSRIEDDGTERPRAVSEYLVERLIAAGATRLCFVISPGKSDILAYYGSRIWGADMVYTVQTGAGGLCDAVFRAASVIGPDEPVVIGLPDTIWFPKNGLTQLPEDALSFLLFPVEKPELFDAVVTDEQGRVQAIDVKQANARSNWVWGAIKMPGHVFHALHALWCRAERRDEYLGTLVNAWLAQGGTAIGVRAGEAYVDVGTLHGYREAIKLLSGGEVPR